MGGHHAFLPGHFRQVGPGCRKTSTAWWPLMRAGRWHGPGEGPGLEDQRAPWQRDHIKSPGHARPRPDDLLSPSVGPCFIQHRRSTAAGICTPPLPGAIHVIDRDPIPCPDAAPCPLRCDRPDLGVARQRIGQGRLHHRRIPGNRPGHRGRLRRGRCKGDLSDRTVRAGARTDPGPGRSGESGNTMRLFDVRGHQRGPGRSYGLDLRGKIRRYRRGRCQRRLP